VHEDGKLREAAHFLERMKATLENPELFQYNLSAFLSAARSVSQYARKEASSMPSGQAWYDKIVTDHPLIGFFTSERNANVHDRPIQLEGHVDVYVSDLATLTESATVEKFDREGNLIEVVRGFAAKPPAATEPAFRLVAHYQFAEWNGPEEVVDLSEQYLCALRALVEDGKSHQFLTATPVNAT